METRRKVCSMVVLMVFLMGIVLFPTTSFAALNLENADLNYVYEYADPDHPVSITAQMEDTGEGEWDFPAKKLIDGKISTAYQVGADYGTIGYGNPVWVKVDLGMARTFEKIQLKVLYSIFSFHYKIEGSNDDSGWNVLTEVTKVPTKDNIIPIANGNDGSGSFIGYMEEAVFAQPVTYRYIKVTMIGEFYQYDNTENFVFSLCNGGIGWINNGFNEICVIGKNAPLINNYQTTANMTDANGVYPSGWRYISDFNSKIPIYTSKYATNSNPYGGTKTILTMGSLPIPKSDPLYGAHFIRIPECARYADGTFGYSDTNMTFETLKDVDVYILKSYKWDNGDAQTIPWLEDNNSGWEDLNHHYLPVETNYWKSNLTTEYKLYKKSFAAHTPVTLGNMAQPWSNVYYTVFIKEVASPQPQYNLTDLDASTTLTAGDTLAVTHEVTGETVPVMIFAAYDSTNKLVAVSTTTTRTSNQMTTSISIPTTGVVGTCTAKMMLWDSLQDMHPVSEFFSYPTAN